MPKSTALTWASRLVYGLVRRIGRFSIYLGPKVLFPAHKVPGTKIWPDFFMVGES